MSRILAIDPGPIDSAYVVIDAATRRPVDFGKLPNAQLLDLIDTRLGFSAVTVIEMVASYGMAVGAEVFETCVWIGRFYQALLACRGRHPDLVKRLAVKTHHCHVANAKDSNICQALVDRFAKGQPNHGKGTRKTPGWFYGFHADVWQAYALAVFAADVRRGAPLLDIHTYAKEDRMTPIEQYAIKLVADGAESYAEDDTDENGEFDNEDDLWAAVDLGVAVARWIGEHPEEVLNLMRQEAKR